VAGSEPDRLQERLTRVPALRILAGIGASLLTAVAFYSVAVEPWTVLENEVAIVIPGLPEALAGYRILLVSDFETETVGTRERQVAAIARRARPDLILVAGDLIDKGIHGARRVRAYERMAAYLGGLPAPDGVWFAQGHGEAPSRMDQEDLVRALESGGVRPLFDDVATIHRGGSSLAVIGIRVHDYARKGAWTIDRDGTITQGPGSRQSYVEYREPGAESWSDYEFSGRLRFESPLDWVGVTVRSRLGDGEDRFYMAVRREYLRRLGASAHGTAYTSGRLSWAREMSAGVWHRFRARVETSGEGVRFRARAWPDTDREPDAWDLDYLDASPARILSGTAGLYGEGPGVKSFTDLEITAGDGTGAWVEPKGADFLLDLMSRVPEGAPVIVLSHTPDIYPDAAALGIPLVLAGHTQGGQVRLPLLGPIIVDTSVGRDKAAGLFIENGSALYVTRGVGTSRLPVRLLSPPEATVITLRPDGDE